MYFFKRHKEASTVAELINATVCGGDKVREAAAPIHTQPRDVSKAFEKSEHYRDCNIKVHEKTCRIVLHHSLQFLTMGCFPSWPDHKNILQSTTIGGRCSRPHSNTLPNHISLGHQGGNRTN